VTGKASSAASFPSGSQAESLLEAVYCGIWHGGKQDLWKLQPPFVCELQSQRLMSLPPEPALRQRFGLASYLSALGWSTNIEITLSGEVSPQELRTFIGALGKGFGSSG